MNHPLNVLRQHVTGAIERGEKQAIEEMPALETTHLRGKRYAVRPKGQLGTCGWHPRPWTVKYVIARSPEEAVRKAMK